MAWNQYNNIEFFSGEAETLPFANEEFDLVVSRLAVHHFSKPELAISEMCRVCKKDGRIFVVDLISPVEPLLQKRYNDLERMRDPSHTYALTQTQLLDTFSVCVERPILRDVKTVEVDFERWVQLSQTPNDVIKSIRQILQAEIDGGEKSGFQPVFVENHLKFFQRWAIIEA